MKFEEQLSMDIPTSSKPTTAPLLTTSKYQRWLRIKLSVAAYAYEYENDSVMSDSEFDKLCTQVDVSISTGNKKLDNYFKKRFDPATGNWVRFHPEKQGLVDIYFKYYKGTNK